MKGSFSKVVLIVIVMILAVVFAGCDEDEALNSNIDEGNKKDSNDSMNDEGKEQQIIKSVEKRMLEDFGMEFDTVEIIDQASNKSKLIKMTRETFADGYGLYNVESEEFFVLPTGIDHVTSYEIINENHVIFNLIGTNSESNYHAPPYSLDCRKTVLEDDNIEFIGTLKALCHPLDESIDFGGKSKHKLTDIIVTLRGLQVAFGPQDQSDIGYFADFSICPYTITSYNDEEREFIIEFKETIIDEMLIEQGLKLDKENANINSIVLEERDNSVFVIIELKEHSNDYYDPKYYTAVMGETPTVPASIDINFYNSDRQY